MELRIFTEPQQGATYDDLLAVAQEAERLGFGAFFRSDHYLGMGTDGLPGPSDAWITLAGLARETSTIRLGTMMTSATFRLPGPLAISVANVDQMSGGRVELGIGAGLVRAGAHDVRHPVPEHGGAVRPVRGAARDHHRAVGDRGRVHLRRRALPGHRLARACPSPTQPKPPVLIGGVGKKRTPALAATYADEFNLPFVDEATTKAQFARVREACEAQRPRPGHDALVQRARALRRRRRGRGRAPGGGDRPREGRAAGERPRRHAEEVVDKIGRYAALGAERLYLQVLDLADLDHLRLVARDVMPHV